MDGPATSFPIVTLGASAGGLAAFEEFFASTPADTGAAFIVITHQHVGHPSLLRELIDRRTPMGVIEVRENTAVAPNQVYIAEPGWMLTIHEGVLKPIEPRDGEGTPTPIDYFLRSLARDQRERAIAIILSGTGNDGSLGIKEIKGALGMVMVQQEQSAAFAGMPHSAIATGLVDYVLPAREMPGTLLAYIRGGGRDLAQTRTPQPTPHEALSQIFTLLRGRTRHDFSQYKRVTVLRRVERRMNVHNLRRIEQYVRFLRETPGELDLLFRDLLIGVTSFFRDVDAFTALAAGLRERLANKPSDYVVRAWVPGCSTGEEVYTIAIILRECMDELDHPLSVQLYATDLDPEAIDIARAGTYPQGIANDVSRQRLARFFHAEEDRFRIRKEIRDMVIFAPQDLIADPPFTRLDLLSCRNLLIYLESELQRRLIPLFHYALKPGGLLLLGSSESIGGYGLLFEPLHKKWKLFRRVEVSEGTYIANFPASLPNASTTLAPRATLRRAGADEVELEGPERLLLREVVPPTVLVHERGDIVHIHGRTGLFLEPSPGPQPVANIFNMARAGLEVGLLAALRHAAAESNEVIHTGVQVRGEGDVTLVDLRVRPVATPGPYHGLYLISFERARSAGPPSASSMTPPDPDDVEGIERRDQLAQLECELQRTREIHQSTIEELETTNEDLKSTNEELQSTNEELQSANEELETSKEEMQSLNEELQTVNAELQSKVEELSRANDDMKNLLNSTDIATLFLDSDLNIKRYTEQARRVIRLIPSDIGRPIGDLVSRVQYDRLSEDAAEVLRTLVLREIEVQGEGDAWYLMRVLPYRTTENVIDGLVITFVDITTVKSEQRLSSTLHSAAITVFGQDRALRYEWAYGPAFGRTTTTELVGRTDAELFTAADASALRSVKADVLERGRSVDTQLTLGVAGTRRRHALHLQPLRADDGAIAGLIGVAIDLEVYTARAVESAG